MDVDFIYLASASPRRRELLSQIGVPFQVLSVEIDESPRAHEAPDRYVVRLAEAKAAAGRMRQDPVASARCSGRTRRWWSMAPSSASPPMAPMPCACCGLLSGRTHEVLTAVALATDKPDSVAPEPQRGHVPGDRARGGVRLLGYGGEPGQGRARMPSKDTARYSSRVARQLLGRRWDCRCSRPRRCVCSRRARLGGTRDRAEDRWALRF